jgi:hypothetical protein
LITLLFLVWLEFSFLWLLFYIIAKHKKAGIHFPAIKHSQL